MITVKMTEEEYEAYLLYLKSIRQRKIVQATIC